MYEKENIKVNVEIKNPVYRFFLKLIKSKPPKITDGNKAIYLWALKYFTSVTFFKLHEKYYDFWRWLTRYYPFSLLYQKRLFHHKNQPVNAFMIRLEKLIQKADLETMILTGQGGRLMTEFYGTFTKKSDNTPENIARINNVLQEKFETVYTKKHEDGFAILVPTQMLVAMNVIEGEE